MVGRIDKYTVFVRLVLLARILLILNRTPCVYCLTPKGALT